MGFPTVIAAPVLLMMRCSDNADHQWCEDFVKLVAMPVLLPVGSSVFPIDTVEGVADFNFLDFTIMEYSWHEHMSAVVCKLSAMDWVDEGLESFTAAMEKLGWVNSGEYDWSR